MMREMFLPRLFTFWLVKLLRKQMRLISHCSYDVVLYQALEEWIQVQKESKTNPSQIK